MYNSLQIGDDKLWYVLVVLRSFRLEVSYQYLLKIKSRQPFFLDEMIAQN